jgi:PAS domain S-box-containing protein
MLNGAAAPEPVSRWIASELFERLPISISVVDPTLTIVASNATFDAVFGEPGGTRTCFQVYKKREEACPACPVLKIFRDGICRVAEATGIDCLGDRADYVVHHTPIFEGGERVSFVVNMSYDVTVAHRFSEELRQESAFRRNITESALDALVATGEDGRVTVYNPAAERLFGLPRAEVVGRLGAERFYPEPFLELLRRGGGASLLLPEVEVRDAGGGLIPVRFSGAVLRSGQRRVGAAAFLQDLRPVKRLEREKLESERLAAVGQTVTQLAHSIKNILTGLQGGLYDIRTGQLRRSPDRVEEGLRTLERNFGRVTALVRDFLRFSREHRLELEPCDPNQVAEEVFDLYREAAARNHIELELERSTASGPVLLDPEALHACLANLVANAIDACIDSGRARGKVRMAVARQGDRLRYIVEDDGCGIAPDVREKLFCSIFTTKGMCGSGLGLMMTKKIVEDHGGLVEVASEPGRGARFTLELPAAGPVAGQGEAHARTDSGSR